ncbi:MAG: cation:proton antiporter [Acidimicrobiia bacterium]|nr:cation:proton antiporter [Acidimicrobiia bacterium]NNF87328.1 cation:proton antiporter [Acidimicrobiia bacterium]NNL14200.1 cation:proton antiporter [Acidimicrobiia bacterium]NNL97403.1 cation:proton antiporter [Acidimicrobiia bacterium]
MEEAAPLIVAFVLGFGAKGIGLPPLVGYLAAGFGLYAFGFESTETIEWIADLGVLLLLFGIGLKLRPRTLARPEVWVTTTAFAAIGTVAFALLLLGLGALGVPLAAELDLKSAAVAGFAFSFCSTVFAVKALERTNETASLAGRVAVGVLVLQDVFAVAFLVAVEPGGMSGWAILALPALIALRPLLGWLLARSDHGELLVLFGFAAALGVGAGIFELAGIKPDLGALLIGILLAGNARSPEMADRLLGFKDLFLVAFFLSIGLGGTPSPAGLAIGAIVLLAVPVRSFVLFVLFTRFRLRARTALFASLTLSTFSEFGLIAASAALAADLLDQAWLSTIAVVVAASFVSASAANAARYRLYRRWSSRLAGFELEPPMPEDAIIDIADRQILVFGMGRVGIGAYDEIVERAGPVVMGVDRDGDRVEKLRGQGRNVIRGDALDRDFWERIRLHPGVELVVAATGNHQANLECIKRVREFLTSVRIASIATYADDVQELKDAGVDVARNLYQEAGQALADDALTVLPELGE